MKSGSLAALVALLGSIACVSACDSDGGGATVPNPDASTGAGGEDGGGKGGGGAAGKGGAGGASGASGGLAGASGGSGTGGKGIPEAGPPDAAVESGVEPTPEAGAPDGGDAGDKCKNFRCVPEYPEVFAPEENPITSDKALLGKVLFWDEQMGELNTMACGTCHRSYAGGSDPRTKDFDSTANRVLAHLPGPDGVIDANPSLTSDDIRGAAGVPACAAATDNVTGKVRQVTTRKPPSYFDAMFALRLFWDGRAGDCNSGDGTNGGCFYDPDEVEAQGGSSTGLTPRIKAVFNPTTMRTVGGALEAQSAGPPVNSTEMGCTDQRWAKIEAKLKTATPLALAKPGTIPPDVKDFQAKYGTYPKMFAAAFINAAKKASDNNDVINGQRIAFAIATHERRLTSNQTPWDRWRAGDDTALTPGQLRGYLAFMGPGRCQFCHAPPLFTDSAFHFIGFHKPASDEGRKVRTGSDADIGKFKTPTLRNVKLREPYGLLHNGAGPGESLETIMTLYKQGGFRSDPDIAAVPIDPGLVTLQLSQQEIDDIIDFMRNGLTDPRVEGEKPPFDRPHLSTESQ